jgi:hypothetical protein
MLSEKHFQYGKLKDPLPTDPFKAGSTRIALSNVRFHCELHLIRDFDVPCDPAHFFDHLIQTDLA